MAGKEPALVYQMKVELLDTHPPIWRRFLVTNDRTLYRLHLILQSVMGWENYHLYRFTIDGIRFGEPDEEYEPDIKHTRRTKLRNVINAEGQKIFYTYDYGDGWEHEILVEKILPMKPGSQYPICLEGGRSCPPEDCGGHPGYGVNVMSTTDIVWIRYAANDLNPGAPDRDKIVKYLHGKQDSDTGRISHDYGDHSDGHAFWQTVRALRILDDQLPRFPAYMEPMLNPSGLDAWFMSFNWDGFSEEKRGNHHEVLGLIPAIVSLENNELAQCLFRNIEKQQNKETGTWPRAKTNISRTFAYTALHLAIGRMPKMPEAIIDEILRMQNENGLWDKQLPSFGSMDSAYLLVRLPGPIGYRQQDATDSLRRLSAAMRRIFAAEQAALLGDTHRMLAVTHAFGLLQEAFPNECKSERPYRFDWDKLDLCACEVITRKQ